MRVGEATTLNLDDVDEDAGVLRIRESKFGKSRLIAIHRSSLARAKCSKSARVCKSDRFDAAIAHADAASQPRRSAPSRSPNRAQSECR